MTMTEIISGNHNRICLCESIYWITLPSGRVVCRECGRPYPPEPPPPTPRP